MVWEIGAGLGFFTSFRMTLKNNGDFKNNSNFKNNGSFVRNDPLKTE